MPCPGAVALLCLTLGVLATLNLGQAVHEKIKLQNTADAAAYSLATLEARTFNFIAFTNRAQITHYHTAMVVQSYLSFAGFALGMMGTAVDMMRGLRDGNQWWCDWLPRHASDSLLHRRPGGRRHRAWLGAGALDDGRLAR